MYRNNDLTAAFGRAQLTRLDEYLRVQRENAAVLTKGLEGLKGLLLPREPEGHEHTYYNYTCRVDGEALGRKGPPARFRDALLKALNAEGVPAQVWQGYILPRMTVFQAKNAYGKGSPWAEHGAMDVDYAPERFPAAQRHAENHFGLTTPLRAPNGPDVARAMAAAIRKVFEEAGALEVEAILKEETR
jgi:dTDP-4-amino-4,6-dideoxygalactose transaminase